MQIDDTFYSFQPNELRGFTGVAEAFRECCVKPEGHDLSIFARRLLDDQKYRDWRNEIHALPATEEMLKREGKNAIAKRGVGLRNGLGQQDGTGQQNENNPDRVTFELGSGSFVWKPPTIHARPLQEQITAATGLTCSPAGCILYPPGGFREWHTNKFDCGMDEDTWFLFLVYADRSHASFFRFVEPDSGELMTSWDEGTTINIFRHSPQRLLWHCVASDEAYRWSFGFRISPRWREMLL